MFGDASPAAFAVLLALLTACQAPAVVFQGRAEPPVVSADQVAEASALPRGATRLGQLKVRCAPLDEWEAFEGRSLVDVDCSERRLRQMLREAGAANGGDVLVRIACAASSCQGELARRQTAVRPGRPLPPADIRGTRGSAVRVDFAPLQDALKAAPREEESVRELPVLPPSHRVIGSFATACDECSELEARDALRIAAASFGASDVVGVRCVPWGPGFHCAGAAAVLEAEQ